MRGKISRFTKEKGDDKMKIVNRKEFLSMPDGTLFRKHEPDIFHDIQIKVDSSENDFVCIDFDWVKANNSRQDDSEILALAREKGKPFKFDYEMTYRDGTYEDEWFAVYEKEDIEELINVLQNLIE